MANKRPRDLTVITTLASNDVIATEDISEATSVEVGKTTPGNIVDIIAGDVNVDSSGVSTIPNDTVTYAKMQNVSATDRILGRDTAGAGDVEEITPANLRTMINVADGANNYVHPNHSGDVTSVADGAQTIANDAVTNAKAANMAVNTIKGRITTGTGDPEDLSAANVRTIINVADGANNYVHPNHSGDVTSVADGAQTIAGDAVTFAKMQNISTDRLVGRDTAATGDPEEISLNSTLEFTGAGAIQRAALTGDIEASAGSNTTAIGSGVIVNADVNASAAIAVSKLSSKPTFVIQITVNNLSTNVVNYSSNGNFANNSSSATEGDVAAPYPNAYVVKRVFIYAQANTKNGNSVLGWRDDGATVASVTITASTTGTFDSGALTVSVAAGSLCEAIRDDTASSSGALSAGGVIIMEAA